MPNEEEHPERPSALWRGASAFTIAASGAAVRAFLFGFCKVETHGLEAFAKLLETRWDPKGRQRGLITGA